MKVRQRDGIQAIGRSQLLPFCMSSSGTAIPSGQVLNPSRAVLFRVSSSDGIDVRKAARHTDTPLVL